jgi:hypothetical protein
MAPPENDDGCSTRSWGGRPPLPGGLRRDQSFRVAFTICDAADVRAIAAGWGVPPGVALWAIVVNQLRRWRHTAPDYGPHGLAIAAALQVLRQEWAEEHPEGREGPSDAE